MKNYTIITTLVFSLFFVQSSFAQEMDFDQINEKAEKQSSSSKKKKNTFINGIGKLYKMTNLDDVFTSSFPKNVKLKNSYKDYKPLLKCVKRIANKKKGGLEGPSVLATILDSIYEAEELSKDSYRINSATINCQNALRGLKRFKVEKNLLINNIDTLQVSQKIKNFLRSIYYPNPKVCQSRDISVSAYWAVGVSAGLNSAKCLLSNGSVRKYLGGNLGIGLGFGGAISSSKVITSGKDENSRANKVFFSEGFSGYGNYTAGIFSEIKIKDENQQVNPYLQLDEYEQSNIGLMFEVSSAKGKLGIRVLNGRSHWGYLLSKLK